MSSHTTHTWRRVPLHVAVAVAVATGAGGAIAGAAIGDEDDDRPAEMAEGEAAQIGETQAVPVWITVREQRRLRLIAAEMPAGWPATEAMMRASVQVLGDAAAREQWRRDADRMPLGWPATEAMSRAAAGGDD